MMVWLWFDAHWADIHRFRYRTNYYFVMVFFNRPAVGRGAGGGGRIDCGVMRTGQTHIALDSILFKPHHIIS